MKNITVCRCKLLWSGTNVRVKAGNTNQRERLDTVDLLVNVTTVCRCKLLWSGRNVRVKAGNTNQRGRLSIDLLVKVTCFVIKIK
jgi:hypothetical protein